MSSVGHRRRFGHRGEVGRSGAERPALRAAQCLVLPKDRLLEVAQRGARFDAEFGDQGVPSPAEDLERLGLPSAAVQRRHQQGAGFLAERVFVDDDGQIGGRDPGLPGAELRLGAKLADGEAHLLEPGNAGREHAITGDVGQCRTAPEVKSGPQQIEGVVGPAVGERSIPVGGQPFESA